jgi:DNA polymerase
MSRDALGKLHAIASNCVACDLHATRTEVVFGSGDAHASLMFIGEAPGREEDLSGVPFVGRSGQLVTKLLAEEFHQTRDWCYIANVVKCRPPANRDPSPVEVATCHHFLQSQIELVAPLLVMPLGNFATRALLGTKVGISSLRGKVIDVGAYQILPTFHPAAALRGGVKVLDLLRADFRLGASLISGASS